MKWPEMQFGESVSGLLIDGVAETPFVGATFRLDDPLGVVVEVPYLSRHESAQFEAVDRWFSEQAPPENMIMRTPEGAVSLFDVQWSGHSEAWGGGKASLGKLRPQEVVFARREGPLSDPLSLNEMHSQLDGLSRWSGSSAVTSDSATDSEGRVQSVSIRLEGGTLLEWRQGEATLKLESHWTHSPERDGFSTVTTLQDTVRLVSAFSGGPHSFWDHFVEQRKLATLLTFVFGSSISFRRHQVRDDRFPARLGGDGDTHEVPLRELLSRRTLRDRTRPVPSAEALGRALVPLALLGSEGLSSWAEKYDDWTRFILPSAGMLGRRAPFVEDVVLSTSMSLEAAGGLLGAQPGEAESHHRGRPTTATHAFRCIKQLGLTWPSAVVSEMALARAIAHNYNGIKHADRGDFPDQVATWLVSQINKFIVRGLALSLAVPIEQLREVLQQSVEMSRIAELFHVNKATLTDDGSWSFAA